MIIELDEYELQELILSLVYLRRNLRDENEYKDIAVKMIKDSYDLENKFIKFLIYFYLDCLFLIRG
jgi:hypothetical protein